MTEQGATDSETEIEELAGSNDDAAQRRPNGLKRILRDPIIGWGLGILGIVLALYFGLQQQQYRHLVYAVNPIRSEVLRAGQVSRLAATYDNKPITTSVTIAQVAIWNDGKLPIKRDNILEAITIWTSDGTPILEAVGKKASRGVTSLRLQTKNSEKGEVIVWWDILEQNDGGVVQLIYAGGPDVGIGVSGIIEGQGEIEFAPMMPSGVSEPQSSPSLTDRFVQLFIVLVCACMILFMLLVPPMLVAKRPLWVRLLMGGIVLIVVASVGFIMVVALRISWGPPFGF